MAKKGDTSAYTLASEQRILRQRDVASVIARLLNASAQLESIRERLPYDLRTTR